MTATKSTKITVKILDQTGQAKEMDITSHFAQSDLSGIRPNFLHQVLHSYLNNSRQATAKTKTRCEVSGGGRKPWKQKGTGRARQGSNRSPLWRTGGVVFGPTGQQNFHQTINQKMKRKALRLAILSNLRQNNLIIVDQFDTGIDSTKKMRLWLEKLPLKNNNLLVFSPESLPLSKFAANLDFVRSKTDHLISALDFFQAQTIIMSSASLESILRRISPARTIDIPEEKKAVKKTVAPSKKTK
jgi:large subunit ribosomal protein L4